MDTVLLDVDGTLVDSTYLHALAWQRAFARHGRSAPWWRTHRTIGQGGDRLVAEVLGQEAEDEFGDALREAWEQEYAALLPELRAVPGARDLVLALRAADLRVALASSGAARFTEHAVDLLGLTTDDLDAVTSADDAEESKPEPDILSVALHRAGGEHAVLVGDTSWDAVSAARHGHACVGVLTGGFARAELLEAGCVLVRDSVADLVSLDWLPRP